MLINISAYSVFDLCPGDAQTHGHKSEAVMSEASPSDDNPPKRRRVAKPTCARNGHIAEAQRIKLNETWPNRFEEIKARTSLLQPLFSKFRIDFEATGNMLVSTTQDLTDSDLAQLEITERSFSYYSERLVMGGIRRRLAGWIRSKGFAAHPDVPDSITPIILFDISVDSWSRMNRAAKSELSALARLARGTLAELRNTRARAGNGMPTAWPALQKADDFE